MERHSTPTPEMPLFTSGVQEPPLLQGITIPALYAAAYECLVLRSILNHLATECFRKGWDWKSNFVMRCKDCDDEYQKEVETCTECGGEVRPPNKDQLDYAKVLLESIKPKTITDAVSIVVLNILSPLLLVIDVMFGQGSSTNPTLCNSIYSQSGSSSSSSSPSPVFLSFPSPFLPFSSDSSAAI